MSFDNYGGDDGFFNSGIISGVVLAIILRLVILKSEARTALYWFLWSLIIIPLFVVQMLIFVNRTFDTSEPIYRKVNVLDQKELITTRKGRMTLSYRIWVESWKAKDMQEEIHIRQDQYLKLTIGDYVYIKTKKGFLNREYLFGPPDQIIEIR